MLMMGASYGEMPALCVSLTFLQATGTQEGSRDGGGLFQEGLHIGSGQNSLAAIDDQCRPLAFDLQHISAWEVSQECEQGRRE